MSSVPSAVLALKRNSSTVRYCFEADAEPGVLPRALELLAKRGLVPARVFAQADADLLSVEIEVEGLEPDTADHVGRCLSQIVGAGRPFEAAVMVAFTIRPARLADAEALCALHKDAVRSLCLGAYTAEEIEAWLREREPEGFRHAMTKGGETMLVAERDGAVAGFASIKGTVLFGLYVDPARGRGAGRVLLQAAEDEVRRTGAVALSLQSTPNAVPFYRKHGYMRQARSTVRRGGRDLAVLEMIKAL